MSHKRSCRLLPLLLAAALLLSACGGKAVKEAVLHLRDTEGTVRISDADGKDLDPEEGLDLFDGCQLRTKEDSWAWLELGVGKLVKLAEDTRAELQLEGRELSIKVKSGGLYFRMTEPLEDGESLTARYSSMSADLSDACGWITETAAGGEVQVYLLEGSARCKDLDGGRASVSIFAGEKAVLSEDEDEIVTEEFTAREVPDFVREELEADEDLLQRLRDDLDMDVLDTVQPVDMELLDLLPYTGDIAQCVLTPAQAGAYADILEEAAASAGDARSEWQMNYPAFCRAALFDAGGGIPALWVVQGTHIYEDSDYGYMPSTSKIYCLDGDGAVLALDTDETGGRTFLVTPDGFLADSFSPEWAFDSWYEVSSLYALSGGRVSDKPVSIYEHFGLYPDGQPTLDDLRAHIGQYSRSGVLYDYDTYDDALWKAPEYDDWGSWMIASLNGEFLSVDDALASGRTLIWSEHEWLLGHGQAGHQDADWDWEGNWADAGETAAILRTAAETAE